MIPVVIGSSAGGPKTLKRLLSGVKSLKIPVVIAQHNLLSEVENFARWIGRETQKKVVLVENRETLKPGVVYFPGKGKDVVLAGRETVKAENSTGSIAPSIDKLFESAAIYLKERAVAIVLGGLGRDGVEGARKIIEIGGRVIVQSDPDFGYLPEQVSRDVRRVVKRSLSEIILLLETMAR